MVYYFETNIIAILIGLLLLIQNRRLSSKGETSLIIMNGMLSMLIILSISDIAAYCFRGKSFAGVHTSNIIYFISMSIGCFLWFLFILVKTEFVTHLMKTAFITSIPTLLLCAAIVLNPLTGFFFTVDEKLLYHRGPGVPFSWVIEWTYLLAALIINSLAIAREKRSTKKSELKGYLVFAIPMAAAAVCQMMFYGTTTTQIGYMLALLMIYINKQHYQVLRDDLTGLNNKNSFLHYRDSLVNRTKTLHLTLFMIDADKFKYINDTYGHMKGDQALRNIADLLKHSCSVYQRERLQLFRYAGDEFIIIGTNMTDQDISDLLLTINMAVREQNLLNYTNGEKYDLSLSIGHATYICDSISDFDHLLRSADEEMYKIKRNK